MTAPNRTFTLLPQTTIATAKTGILTDTLMLPYGLKSLTVQALFNYGAGGTDATAWVQTSLDDGTTWMDIMAFNFTTSAATKVSAVRQFIALAAVATPTDGTLTDDTILDGCIGDRVRVKWTTTGTYTGITNLRLTGVVN